MSGLRYDGSLASSGGALYVMFDGTPYAHLMVYQNPNFIK
jgi:hypothetical protein